MKVVATKNRSLLTTAFTILLQQLGPQKTNRLWQVLMPSKTEYTKVRRTLFKGKSLQSLFSEAKRFNKQ